MRPDDDVNASSTPIKTIEDEWSMKPSKKDEVDSLESIVRIKEAELKTLVNSHCDYYEMKMRMHMEIAGLLSRMEASKQLLAAMACLTFLLLIFLQRTSII